MSTKQLAQTVKDGRKLRFNFPSGDPLVGYLGGMDDYHWLVVTATSKHLIHKGNVTMVDIFSESTYDREMTDDMEAVIGPFRRYIDSNHELFFGKPKAMAS